jgi:signal transduction histidine kinase
VPAAHREVIDLLAGHRRIVIATLGVVLVGMAVMALAQITQVMAARQRQAVRSLDDALLRVQPFVAGVTQQVEALRLHLEEVLVVGDHDARVHLDELRMIKPDRFAIPVLPAGRRPGDLGNLTGVGQLGRLTNDQQHQLTAALALDPLFRIGRNNLAEVAWSYVTTDWFIHLHPFRPASEYSFWGDEDLLTHEFYTRARPQENPERETFWTAAYQDGAGLGLMVTCASPVYQGDRFIGSVALDVTLDGLNRVLRAVELQAGATLVVVNHAGQVLSGPAVSSADEQISTLARVLPALPSLTAQRLASLPVLVPTTIDGHQCVTAEVPITGWRLLVVRPSGSLWSDVLAAVVPWLALSLAIVLTALITAAVMIRQAYVQPAQRLVQRLGMHGQDGVVPPLALAEVPAYWQPWFAEVDQVFAANRALLRAVEQARDNLTHLVEVRTSELSSKNRQLEQALANLQRMQETLIEREKLASLGQLVAGLSHELNTPVGVALGAATHLDDLVKRLVDRARDGQLLRRDLDAFVEESARAARLVESNLAQAARLVRSFKRVSADQTTGERRTIDLPAYLSEVMTSLSGLLHRQHTVRLRQSPPIGLDTCPGALTQVITNLVENAVIHAFPPGSSGTISLAAIDLGNRVQIVFQDDGVGMAEEVREHIFEPFFTTRRGQGGTGLGLSIVYTLVTGTLGGEIGCDSAPGVGTTFTIDLPRSPSRL